MGQFMHFDGVKPGVLKILHRLISLPHIAPRPSPPCANDTVTQCMHEIESGRFRGVTRQLSLIVVDGNRDTNGGIRPPILR